ncbi:PREDICTED: male-specific submandibular salivary gland protein-like isoform X2 [Chinchilla lanigera]|uniref:male-specific submandibular salivary gland protein-like isoform X2 n=1 Tax=Chinchilla lanigera TaxID=34839 RepID=UPI00038EA5C5|nr:PREDICTED: male-specific submandibular salivary gland protein-like isoform X2 [Chinchilla lanigera]
MQLLLLAFAVGLVSAHDHIDPSEVSGDWHTISLAADNFEKIDGNGPLQIYLRHLECKEECKKLALRFYAKANGQCQEFNRVGVLDEEKGVYVAEYAGKNFFEIIAQKDDVLAFFNHNIDEEGKETNVITVVGKRDSLTEEEKQKLVKVAEEKGIPKENIRHVAETDTCPE